LFFTFFLPISLSRLFLDNFFTTFFLRLLLFFTGRRPLCRNLKLFFPGVRLLTFYKATINIINNNLNIMALLSLRGECMPELSHLDLAGRLLLAALLGGLVGFERERHNRPAGLRTHILVCVGATLIMMVSVYGFGGDGAQGDQARIAAQVVSGIGFLGAGTIMRQGSIIRGLTTAASLWVVAAIGLAVGIKLHIAAVAATALVLVSLYSLSGVESYLARGRCKKSLWIRAVDQPGLLGRVGTVLGDHNVSITNVNLSSVEFMEAYGAETIGMDIEVRIPGDFNSRDLMQQLLRVPGMLEVSWEGDETGTCSLPR
jgi:putative Mg2+ transporter-C (MgtC) family protein